MEERIKVLEMVRDGKISPEQGVELLRALEQDGDRTVLESFVDLHQDDGSPARHLQITTISFKDGKEKKFSFNLPLGMLKFVNSLFPNSLKLQVNAKHLDREQLMEMIHKGEKGVIYREKSEKGEVIIELV